MSELQTDPEEEAAGDGKGRSRPAPCARSPRREKRIETRFSSRFGPAADTSLRAGRMSQSSLSRHPWAHLPPDEVPGGVRQPFLGLARPRRNRPRHGLRPRPREGRKGPLVPLYPRMVKALAPSPCGRSGPPCRRADCVASVSGLRISDSPGRSGGLPHQAPAGRRGTTVRTNRHHLSDRAWRGLGEPGGPARQAGNGCRRRACFVRALCEAPAGPVQGLLRPAYPCFNLEKGVLS